MDRFETLERVFFLKLGHLIDRLRLLPYNSNSDTPRISL